QLTWETDMNTQSLVALMIAASMTAGCASTYSNLVSGHGLGAKEYRPAVYVPAGKEGEYEQILSICRDVAVNRQITAAQQAQLKTITGSVEGVADGASMGLVLGTAFDDIGKGVGIGAAAGLLSSVAGAFSRGAD